MYSTVASLARGGAFLGAYIIIVGNGIFSHEILGLLQLKNHVKILDHALLRIIS